MTPGIEAPIDPPQWDEAPTAPFVVDDGPLDTVIECGECGKQLRFNPDFEPDPAEEEDKARIDEAFAMFSEDHLDANNRCAREEGPRPAPDWNPENR